MTPLTSFHVVQKGDVVLCEYDLEDKVTGRPFTWRWFAISIDDDPSASSLWVWHVGGRKGEEEKRIRLTPWPAVNARQRFMLLDESEWPDGVHVFRMRLILEGQIDII